MGKVSIIIYKPKNMSKKKGVDIHIVPLREDCLSYNFCVTIHSLRFFRLPPFAQWNV